MGLDCRGCDDRLKRERGCITKGTVAWYIGNKQYRRCPLKIVPKGIWEYIRAYSFYKQGILPHGRGWLNESDKFLTAMDAIEAEVGKIKIEKQKKKRKTKHA